MTDPLGPVFWLFSMVNARLDRGKAWQGHLKEIRAPFNARIFLRCPVLPSHGALVIDRDGRWKWNIRQQAHKYGHLMFILFGFHYRASGVNLVTSSLHSMMWEDSQIYSGDPVMSNLPVNSPAFPVPAHGVCLPLTSSSSDGRLRMCKTAPEAHKVYHLGA